MGDNEAGQDYMVTIGVSGAITERVLMGQLGSRHGNVQETKGGRAVFLFL